MRSKFLTLFLVIVTFSANGQYVIKGRVLGKDDKLPLPQVSVMITGTNQGVPTDTNGEFTLETETKSVTLTLKYLGYVTQVVKPEFVEFNLIYLKPDCIRDHFRSPHMTLFGSFDISNSQPGGRLEMRLPYRLNANIFTTHSFYTFGEKEHVYRGEVLYNDIIHGCDLELDLQYSVQSYSLPQKGLDFKSTLISTLWQFDETIWILGMGIGQDRLSEKRDQFLAFQAGFKYSFRLGINFYLPIIATATRWRGFSEYNIATYRSVGPLETRLEFNHIKGFSQINLSVGWYIRLRKLNEFEKAGREKKRSQKRHKKLSKKN